MQIPVVSGITSEGTNLRVSLPVNMVPVAKQSGVSQGYLRPASGLVSMGTGPGIDRGGINWDGVCYRVMGTKLVTVSSAGVVTTLGDVGGTGRVTLDYGFDRLAIASGGNLYYWDGSTLTQVTDPDLGTVVDFSWVDGYYMTTDGESLIVTELTDPTAINPLKYGSSEADPDPVVAIKRIRTEIWAVNRYSCEVFNNIGGDLFPFLRQEGAQVQKGAINTHSVCVISGLVAFVGGGRNEALGIYIAENSSSKKISTADIDQLLSTYSETEQGYIFIESMNEQDAVYLYVHLPDRTLVYNLSVSLQTQTPTWHTLVTGVSGFAAYRGQSFVHCYGQWLIADKSSTSIGKLSEAVASHWGAVVRWQFSTPFIYNESRNAIVHSLELVSLNGNMALGSAPRISASYSTDGISWSMPRSIAAGTIGDRLKRLVWFRHGFLRNFRVERFQGDSTAMISVLRLEANIEALA